MLTSECCKIKVLYRVFMFRQIILHTHTVIVSNLKKNTHITLIYISFYIAKIKNIDMFYFFSASYQRVKQGSLLCVTKHGFCFSHAIYSQLRFWAQMIDD